MWIPIDQVPGIRFWLQGVSKKTEHRNWPIFSTEFGNIVHTGGRRHLLFWYLSNGYFEKKWNGNRKPYTLGNPPPRNIFLISMVFKTQREQNHWQQKQWNTRNKRKRAYRKMTWPKKEKWWRFQFCRRR